jgi:hypothetical protein
MVYKTTVVDIWYLVPRGGLILWRLVKPKPRCTRISAALTPDGDLLHVNGARAHHSRKMGSATSKATVRGLDRSLVKPSVDGPSTTALRALMPYLELRVSAMSSWTPEPLPSIPDCGCGSGWSSGSISSGTTSGPAPRRRSVHEKATRSGSSVVPWPRVKNC